MHADERIHFEELRAHIDRQIEAGAHAIFCLGTNGEFYALSDDEKRQVICCTVEQVNGRVPVLAGTGCITTKETIALTHFAAQAGCDAVSVITPYFAGMSADDVLHHYTGVADACEIPLIVYNIPARTGVNVSYQTLKKLAAHPNIVGVKDSSGNFDNTLRYIEETPDDFLVFCGNDSLILWTLMAGGHGGISGIANIFPKRMVEIYAQFASGNLTAAKKVQDSVRCIRDALVLGNPNSIIKRAANLNGYPLGPARAPFDVRSPEVEEKILAALAYYRKLEEGAAR